MIKIMQSIAGLNSNYSKDLGLKMSKKIGFDILARCYDNTGLPHLTNVVIQILKSSD